MWQRYRCRERRELRPWKVSGCRGGRLGLLPRSNSSSCSRPWKAPGRSREIRLEKSQSTEVSGEKRPGPSSEMWLFCRKTLRARAGRGDGTRDRLWDWQLAVGGDG
ncbi:hypothetical protein FKM82_018718 [Ascaphus truei]